MLSFTGSRYFRQRLMLATLSGRPIKISSIRPSHENPGLKEYEIRFLKFLEQLTNGSSIEISYTGTSVIYKPGMITGGAIEFDCGLDRSVVYFLEPVLALAPFSKTPFRLTLSGLTSDTLDITVDTFRNVSLKLLFHFGVKEGIELKIHKRGAAPLGGGSVFFTCPVVSVLQPVLISSPGRIKRIRGIAACTRVSPQIANRLVEASRSVLNAFIPDIYIHSDVYKGEEAGKSPGFSLSLVAESTTYALVSADGIGLAGETPETVARRVSKKLLKEIATPSMIDARHQWLVLTLMAFTTQDVSKASIGELSKLSRRLLEDIETFTGVAFRIQKQRDSEETVATCVGMGYTNFSKCMQ